MVLLMIFMCTLVLIMIISSLNPIKMVFTLMLLSSVLFVYLFISSSTVWMSSIYFLIFIGGIMIMFMILSSLLPNEKSLKIKSIILLTTLGLTLCFSGFSVFTQSEIVINQELKVMFLSNESFEVLMMVILLYFLSFIYIVSKENCSLRSFEC